VAVDAKTGLVVGVLVGGNVDLDDEEVNEGRAVKVPAVWV
jgi:hypothetical protein